MTQTEVHVNVTVVIQSIYDAMPYLSSLEVVLESIDHLCEIAKLVSTGDSKGLKHIHVWARVGMVKTEKVFMLET